MVKFADDTVIVCLLNNGETPHSPLIDHVATLRQGASLELNASKTKDMCIDFRRNVINTEKKLVSLVGKCRLLKSTNI